MKIGVCVSHYGVIKSKTVLSLMNLMELPYKLMPIFRYGSYISENKEKLIKTALKHNCTHIFFVDYDVVFSPQVLVELIEADKEVIGAYYNYKYLPTKPMIKVLRKEELPDETFKAAAIGGGCLLIKSSVFKKISKPYFPMEYDDEGNVVCTEDTGFCEKTRDAGIYNTIKTFEEAGKDELIKLISEIIPVNRYTHTNGVSHIIK